MRYSFINSNKGTVTPETTCRQQAFKYLRECFPNNKERRGVKVCLSHNAPSEAAWARTVKWCEDFGYDAPTMEENKSKAGVIVTFDQRLLEPIYKLHYFLGIIRSNDSAENKIVEENKDKFHADFRLFKKINPIGYNFTTQRIFQPTLSRGDDHTLNNLKSKLFNLPYDRKEFYKGLPEPKPC